MNLNVSERLICTIGFCHGQRTGCPNEKSKQSESEERSHGDDGGGRDCPLVGGTAGPCTVPGGRPVDTSSGPRSTLQTDIWYAAAQMSCLATSMCEITYLFLPSTWVKESIVAHSFSALFL